jgi:hypothetical protein
MSQQEEGGTKKINENLPRGSSKREKKRKFHKLHKHK